MMPSVVASFTDAWIETGLFGSIGAGRRSHLLQMRGLKPPVPLWHWVLPVASFTDAWIETLNIDNFVKAASSHLLQMRGLKQLKPARGKRKPLVASFTDAWIETLL